MRPLLALGLLACAAVVLALYLRLDAIGADGAVDPSSVGDVGVDELVAPALHTSDPVAARSFVPVAAEPSPGVAPRMHIASARVEEVDDVVGTVEVRVVRDEDGTPLEAVTVRAGGWGSDDVRATDANGIAFFEHMPLGRYSFSAAAPVRLGVTDVARVSSAEPHARVELRIQLEHAFVVRLLDPTGGPFRPADWLSDARVADRFGVQYGARCGAVHPTDSATDARIYKARRTDAEDAVAWRIVARGKSGGCVQVALGDVVVATALVDANAEEVALRVDTAALDAAWMSATVCVVDDATGAPIAGASVEFPSLSMTDAKRTSAHDGCVRVSFVPLGSTRVIVRAAGYTPTEVEVSRESATSVVARLVRARRIAGRVVDADGAPVAEALVQVIDARLGAVTTEADGTFAFDGVPAARVEVGAVLSSIGPYHAQVEVDARAGDVLDVRLVFLPAATPTPKKYGTGRR